MTETKRPEFNLHKKPEPLPDPTFEVITDGDTCSIKMNGYVVLGGISEKAATDLQHKIYMAVVEPRNRLEGGLMQAAMQTACQNNSFMQHQRSNSFNDLIARTTLGIPW